MDLKKSERDEKMAFNQNDILDHCVRVYIPSKDILAYQTGTQCPCRESRLEYEAAITECWAKLSKAFLDGSIPKTKYWLEQVL
jgi:hypothetical protein